MGSGNQIKLGSEWRKINMNTDLYCAIIGVIGTLFGTVLGWLLNSVSKKGKLNIYVYSWEDEFMYNCKGRLTKSSSEEQTEHYGYKLSLDLYNSSGETKIMRNIRIVFVQSKDKMLVNIPKDETTKRIGQISTHYDDINVVNIPSKSVININLHSGKWRSDGKNPLECIWNTNKVYLLYVNEKNQEKKILIKEECYKDYFKNNITQI